MLFRSDPPIHWICSFLDKYRLLSNSDAHSPEKLGRNANNTFAFGIDDDTVSKSVASTNVYTISRWYHVAGVRNSTHMIIYVDGVEEGSLLLPENYGSLDAAAYNLLIGGSANRWNGLIDEVRLYKIGRASCRERV